jgi:lipopolysaccharide export system ATP-binding protein
MHDPGSTLCHTETAVLFAKGLRKTYGGRAVVDGVSITVQPREIVGLLGPNGAGKTTLFYMIAGLIPVDAGSVSFGGHDISKLPMHRRARLGLGYLPQEESVFRKLSVMDNLLAILETRPHLSRTDRLDRAHDLLNRFGITRLAKSLAITLSGGEKRRLAIARSLCSDPTMLMLDEPFAGIDPIAVEDIQRIVRELRDRDGLAIIITDRAFLIHDGRVILEGASDELVTDPIARKHYLGDDFRM